MSAKRNRSTSAVDEKNVTEFVDSCTSFKCNVSFHAVKAAEDSDPPDFILLIGTQAELAHESVPAVLPFWSKPVAAAVASATVGKLYATNVGPARLFIGIVPTQASRHNCQARPDVITDFVREAAGSSKKALAVFVMSTSELCIAAAVARGANRSFSAKKGLAQKSYLNVGIDVKVYFPTETLKSRAGSLEIVATNIQLCQRLVDAPTNLLDTITFTEIATVLATRAAAHVDVISGDDLREKGYGGLYGVGKAAEYPPALVTLTYAPKLPIQAQKKISLVGKGIVYDTGGLAIKTPASGMCTMKHDMGGAAAVFCGFLTAVQLDAQLQLSCTLCLADNAIGPRSFRNDDILLLRSGLTVEVNNTDAEGRLVLSDGVYHASALLDFVPDVIIDMATLTGAQGIATGKHHAAIFTNSGEWESRTVDAGRSCGDLCFPILYCPEFHNSEFASKVADYKNSVANRGNAQSSCAGQFIGNSLASDFKGAWVHVDLASPATRDEGTGYGVALLTELFTQSQDKALL